MVSHGPVLENIVYNYARALGYEISIGKIGKLEVDFILRDMNMDYSYIQVARYIDNGFIQIMRNGKCHSSFYSMLYTYGINIVLD